MLQRYLTFAVIAGLLIIAGCSSAARSQRARLEATQEPDWSALSAAMDEAMSGKSSIQPEAGLRQVSLDELLRMTQTRSPLLGAAYYRWKAAVERIGTAFEMPEAMLEYREFMQAENSNIRLMDERRSVMLSQMFPNPGKLVARQDMLAADAEVMSEEFDAVRRELRARVIASYVNVQALDSRADILGQLVGLARDLESLMEPMFSTGEASQADLLRMQVEREEMESDLASLALRRLALLKVLEAASGVALDRNAKLDALPAVKRVEAPSRVEQLIALEAHPMVQMSHAQARVAQAKVIEARWMWVPDFFVAAEWMQMNVRSDMPFESAVAFRVGITIPWNFGANAARSNAAEAERMAAKFVIAQKRLDLQAELDAMLFELADAERMMDLQEKSILPKARQALELIRTDFSSSKATLTDVISAWQAWLGSELSFVMARSDALKARAAVEALTGLPLKEKG
jgi:outer membrane protein, heavy metal efflux system